MKDSEREDLRACKMNLICRKAADAYQGYGRSSMGNAGNSIASRILERNVAQLTMYR